MILKRVISFHQIANERGERHNTLFPSKHNDFHTCGFKNGFKKKKTGFKFKFYIYCFTPLANHCIFQVPFALLERSNLPFSLFKWN